MRSFSPLAGTALLALAHLLSTSVYAAVIPSRNDDTHDHVSQDPLPGSWYHDDDHFAHALFRRQNTNTPSFPEVGSPTWSAAYPVGTPNSGAMPQAWKDALNTAVQAGLIPNIPPSAPANPGGGPVYPNGLNGASPQVCSWSFGCVMNDTIVNAPPGVVGVAFDDGPLPVRLSFSFRVLLPSEVDPFVSFTCYKAFRCSLRFPSTESGQGDPLLHWDEYHR
jgi:chitin deacetylase